MVESGLKAPPQVQRSKPFYEGPAVVSSSGFKWELAPVHLRLYTWVSLPTLAGQAGQVFLTFIAAG